MDLPLLTPSRTVELLRQLRLHPRKNLGQNFLVDSNLVRKSLSMAGVSPGDHIVEIGPGLGALTRGLLNAGAHVHAIEKDPVLSAHLREDLLPQSGGRLELVDGDAMDHPHAKQEPSNPFKIVANLPYAITTPWMEKALKEPLPERMVLLVQREAAQRFLAEPGSKSLGPIAIFLQSAYSPGGQHKVSRNCFLPTPEVDSSLVCLERRETPFLFGQEERQTIRHLFTRRRKQLKSLCEGPELENWLGRLEEAGFPGTSRPEQVPIELWRKLGD